MQRGSPSYCLFQSYRNMPQDRQHRAAQLCRVPQHSVRDSHALQESGCFKGKAKPLSIAASLMMGSFTTTQSLSWKEVEHWSQGSLPQQKQSICHSQQTRSVSETQDNWEIPASSQLVEADRPMKPLPRSCSPVRLHCPGDSHI